MITYFRSLSSCYRVTLFATPHGIYSMANGPLFTCMSKCAFSYFVFEHLPSPFHSRIHSYALSRWVVFFLEALFHMSSHMHTHSRTHSFTVPLSPDLNARASTHETYKNELLNCQIGYFIRNGRPSHTHIWTHTHPFIHTFSLACDRVSRVDSTFFVPRASNKFVCGDNGALKHTSSVSIFRTKQLTIA